MRTFHGTWPALVTPFTADNQVNVPVLKDLVAYHLGKQIDGFYVGGTTGEGVFMSVAERQLVVETVIHEVDGRVPVIVHVGCTALVDATALARHAQASGAAGVSSIIPPLYTDMNSLLAYFQAVAAAVPELPVFPYFLSQNINPLALMRRLLPVSNIAGTKYTGPDMHEFRQIVELGANQWTIFSGMDEVCVFAAMMGADGNIGSTLNFMPGVYRQIHAYLQSGDTNAALALQLRANRVTAIIVERNLMGGLKAAIGFLGFDCGGLRLPRFAMTPDEVASLREALEAADFFALAAM
jgi:N-acetylneuraminate lyase